MKRLFVGSIILSLFFGCADKPMATSVIDLAGNQTVVGWDETNDSKSVPIKKVEVIKYKPLKDSDSDGVVDNLDKCPNTPKNTIVDHNGCPIITTLRFNFDFNKADVKKIYYPQIKKIADTLKNNPKLKIEIAGYTDNMGSEQYNLKLSLKRAEAVKNILVKKFKINPKRIIVKGYGEKYPLFPNTTLTNKVLNRRVEIIDITNKK